ncbi:tape measure protein [Dysgonomonas reticulitermitis]
MNVLNYVLNVNGNVLSMLNRIGAASGSSRNDVRGLRNEVEGLNTVNLSGLTSKITGVFATLGIGAILGKTVSDGMEHGMKNVSFEVLFGGAEPAKKMIDDINSYAAKAYGKTALTNGVQMMAGFDIAKDEIMPNLRAIADIAMGDVNKFNSLTLAFSQMSSTGKLMGQDLLQMINAGFNPLNQMSKTTGKSVATLKDEMSKGLISSQMVKQAFYDATGAGGQFNGMIERMSNETGGLWKGALSKIDLWMNRFYNWIEPVLKPALQGFNKLLDDPIGTLGRLTDKFTSDFPIISGLIIGVTAALTAYKVVTGLITIATGLWTAAQWLLNAALTANPVGLIIAGVVALIALIAFLIIKIDGWGDTWDNVIKLCTLVFDSFKANLQLKWLQIQDFFMKGLETIEKGWYKLQSLWNEDAANAGLAKLESQRNERAKEIAEVKGKIDDINNQISNLDVIQLKVNDTSFSDVANSLKSKLGISSPGIPGTDMTPGGGTGGSGGIGGGTGGKAGKDTANSIATGGSKTTHIYVTVGEMGNNMKIYVNDLKEGAENIRDIVLDQLTRALTMAQGQI